MADNIPVKPSDAATKVNVATDEVTDSDDNVVHYPVYKMAIGASGEAVLIDTDSPVPVESLELEARIRVLEVRTRDLLDVNEEMLNQLKLMNTHFSEWDGDEK